MPKITPFLWLSGPDPAASGRVMQALLKMAKLDIAALRAAFQAKEQRP